MSSPAHPNRLDLAEHGLRSTRPRRAIYRSLRATDTHPSADELFRRVRPQIPGLSLATVYNTLEALCRAGLAVKLPGHGSSARYDATVRNHLHTRCERTGAMDDVPPDLSDQLIEHLPQDVLDQIEARLGFSIRQVQIQLVGQYHNGQAHQAGAEP